MTLPPPLQNFYKVREGPPNPSGKVYFHEKRRVMPFAVTQWFSFNFFERLELEHSKLYLQNNLNYKILLIPLNEGDKVVSVSSP